MQAGKGISMKEGDNDVTYSLNIDGSTVKFVKDTANATQMITNSLPDAISSTVLSYNPNTGLFTAGGDSGKEQLQCLYKVGADLMLCKSLTYPDDTVTIKYANGANVSAGEGATGSMQFVQRENATQNITMKGVDFRKSFTMTKPDSSYVVSNAPYIDKYAIYRVAQDVANGRVYFVGVSKIYYFTVISEGVYTFVQIFQGERRSVDAVYYIDDDGALIVSGGIYLDTRLPCYKSWKYNVVNGFLQESLLKDANTKLSKYEGIIPEKQLSDATVDDFCVLGDSVNNKVAG